MNISFLAGTKIGIVEDICSKEEIQELYELLLWADSHGFQLNNAKEDDQSMMEKDADQETLESHVSDWAIRNYSIEMYPSRYHKIAREVIESQANEAFRNYLEMVGRSGEDFRPITLNTFHVLKGGDEIDAHVDCFDYGIVYYVDQTEDVEGGDLRFIKDDIYLPFRANRLLIIPSDIEHEVTPVVSGRRFTSTDFVPVGKGWESRTI